MLIPQALQYSAQSGWFLLVPQGQGHQQPVNFDSVTPGAPVLGLNRPQEAQVPEYLGRATAHCLFFFLSGWLTEQKTLNISHTRVLLYL